MKVKEARQAALLRLLDEDEGPKRGRKSRLATRIGKKPAQLSQWLSGFRTIEEDTAREIERRAGKAPRWMDMSPLASRADGDIDSSLKHAPEITLTAALERIARELARDIPLEHRAELAEAFATWAKYRGGDTYRATVAELLAGAVTNSGKRSAEA